jgi:hypothetical protein
MGECMFATAGILVKRFSPLEKSPVKINDVVLAIRDAAAGAVEDIEYFEADINSEHLRGQLIEATYSTVPDGAGFLHRKHVIFFASSLDQFWRRLVICKELIHILDPDVCKISTPDALKHLISKIVIPPEFDHEVQKCGPAVLNDRNAEYIAVAVLFPLGVRNVLMNKYKQKKIGVIEISKLVGIPPKYVVYVMHDNWPEILKLLETL